MLRPSVHCLKKLRKGSHAVSPKGAPMTRIVRKIQLTDNEEELLKHVEFDPSKRNDNGQVIPTLISSLDQRNAIPFIRKEYNKAVVDRISDNADSGINTYAHPHFLPILWNYIYGPVLPPDVIAKFEEKVESCGTVTSGDVIPLANYAKALVTEYRLDRKEAATEFLKLALELELPSCARPIYDAVMKLRIKG